MLSMVMGNIELVMGGVIAMIVLFFGGVYKYRGFKVEAQKGKIEDLEQKRDVVNEYIQAKNRAESVENAERNAKELPPDHIYKLEPRKRYKI